LLTLRTKVDAIELVPLTSKIIFLLARITRRAKDFEIVDSEASSAPEDLQVSWKANFVATAHAVPSRIGIFIT